MFKCPRCQSPSRNDSRFCASCGMQFSAPAVVKNKTNPFIIVAIVLAVLFSCGLCGLIGKLGDKPKSVDSAQTSASNSALINSRTSPPPIPSASSTPIPEVTAPKTLFSTTEKTNTAIVITENADLREAPGDEGEVVQTVDEGETVEVIKQKGAWFYVLAGSRKGWLHGNTIRLVKPEQKSVAESKQIEAKTDLPKSSPSYDSPSPTVSRKTPEPEINNSGATAKCRDGSLSYSAHRRGTCSHHGGVAVWY